MDTAALTGISLARCPTRDTGPLTPRPLPLSAGARMTAAGPLGASGPFAVARLASGRARSRSAASSGLTNDEILAAVRLWTARYGEPPTTVDWDPSRARRLGQGWRPERFEDGSWPTAKMVSGRFKLFNAAVEQAGLIPRKAPSRLAANLAGPEGVLTALTEWTRRYGDVPTMADWDPHRARRLGQHWRVARYYQGDWPSARTVAHHFGSFTNAMLSAGPLPRDRGKHHDDRRDAQAANRLSAAHVLAKSRRPGIEDFAAGLRALAVARRRQDPVALHAALIDVAASAQAWAQICCAEL
jgi:hypothetical protein